MTAPGGVIGAGHFVGSGAVIEAAGPGAVFSFVVTLVPTNVRAILATELAGIVTW